MSTAISYLIYNNYKNNYLTIFNKLLIYYVVGLFIGFAIYIFFPNSTDLWMLLSSYGVELTAPDPHVNRFVSVYFDPNYYSIIAIIPMLLSSLLYLKTNRFIYLLLIGLFAISIFLAGSRSGIVSMVAILLYILLPKVFSVIVSLKVKKGIFFPIITILLLLLMSFPFYIENLETLWGRLLSTGSDDSGNARYSSFLIGVDIIKQYPLFGMGYNYLSQYMLSKGLLSSVDSSLVAILCHFGFVLSSFVFVFIGLFLINLYKRIKAYNDSNLLYFIKIFYFYLFVTIFFASNFNNILFYFFWIIPVMVILFYLYIISKKSKRRAILDFNNRF